MCDFSVSLLISACVVAPVPKIFIESITKLPEPDDHVPLSKSPAEAVAFAKFTSKRKFVLAFKVVVPSAN